MFGYDDPEYGKDECLVYGKTFWPVASPRFSTIAINALIYIPIFSIWRWVFERYMKPKAIEYAKGQQLKKGNTTSFEINVRKYQEAYWKTITNSILMFYGFYALAFGALPQFWNPSLLFESWPQTMNTTELIYYRLAIGYHGHRALYGLFYEKKRADFLAYVLHHWVTVILIVTSWSVGLSQHGVLVMCFHDSADVFLSASKTFSYHNYRIGVELSFVLFVLSWIVFRLALYPLKVIYPTLVYKRVYDCHPLYWLFVILLSILLILHIYWGQFILPVIIKIFKSPQWKMYDPRSGSDDDNDKTKNKTTNKTKTKTKKEE